MPTSEAGSKHAGFTLIELLVVLAIMAIATAGVVLSLRDSTATVLERDAQRLAALLEVARAQSRLRGVAVRWQATEGGFAFAGLEPAQLPGNWLSPDVQATGDTPLLLGPEPIIGVQRVVLRSRTDPQRSLTVLTDGVRPFAVQADADAPGPAP